MRAVLDAAGGTPAVTLRAIALAAIAIATGAIVFRWFVLQRAGTAADGERAALDRLAADAGFLACSLLIVVAVPRVWFQALSFVDAGVSPMTMIPNVNTTMWGTGLWLQLVTSSIAAIGFRLARLRHRSGWIVASVAMAAVTFSPSLMGHPIAAEQRTWLNVGADWLHVISAGGWVGALTLLALAARRCAGDVTAALIAAFHHVALVSVLGLLVTGSLSLVLRLQKLGDLPGSAYGTIFFVKIGCVAVVAAFGFWHSRLGERRARAGTNVRTSLMAEVAFAAATIVVTAVLVGTEPPGV